MKGSMKGSMKDDSRLEKLKSKLNSINFDEKFVDMILERKKKSTIRKGIKLYKKGKKVELTAGGKSFGMGRIVKVVVKRVSELNNSDAVEDGFSSKEELLKELERIYGNIEENEFVTIIHFEFLDNIGG